jgi:hypothetical protein
MPILSDWQGDTASMFLVRGCLKSLMPESIRRVAAHRFVDALITGRFIPFTQIALVKCDLSLTVRDSLRRGILRGNSKNRTFMLLSHRGLSPRGRLKILNLSYLRAVNVLSPRLALDDTFCLTGIGHLKETKIGKLGKMA